MVKSMDPVDRIDMEGKLGLVVPLSRIYLYDHDRAEANTKTYMYDYPIGCSRRKQPLIKINSGTMLVIHLMLFEEGVTGMHQPRKLHCDSLNPGWKRLASSLARAIAFMKRPLVEPRVLLLLSHSI
jgi:hypothetical protein